MQTEPDEVVTVRVVLDDGSRPHRQARPDLDGAQVAAARGERLVEGIGSTQPRAVVQPHTGLDQPGSRIRRDPLGGDRRNPARHEIGPSPERAEQFVATPSARPGEPEYGAGTIAKPTLEEQGTRRDGQCSAIDPPVARPGSLLGACLIKSGDAGPGVGRGS